MAEDKDLLEEESSFVTLCDEDGNEVSFEFLDLIEFEGAEYAVLLPDEDCEEGGELVILEVTEDEEDPEAENYNGVTDARVLEAVYELFKERNKDEFQFQD